MEEFLPLLIGVIWLVYTLYNRGQKKKNPHKPHQAEKAGDKTPSFLEQLFMGEGVERPTPYYAQENDIETTDVLNEFEEVVRNKGMVEPFLKEELSDLFEEGQPISEFSEFEENEYIKAKGFEFENGEFDLKKAIVFSEILNAPYIDYK